jgi:putative DNA-invertase from lambdoid prophage Rac
MQVLGAVAEFERDLLVERTQSGLARAKSQGKKLGRPLLLSEEKQREIAQKRVAGASFGALAKEYGVDRSAIQRSVARSSK